MEEMIERLIRSEEPSIRYKALVHILGRNPESPGMRSAREEIRSSARVARLLSHREESGRIADSPYAKYTGAHWTLTLLADLGYPPGDTTLLPLRDQVYERWLHPEHVRERIREREASSRKSHPGVPIIQGRARRCASQEGNALHATLALGIADERADQLAAHLLRWQWPDGGWNCDRKAGAVHSSFGETLAPLRGLALYSKRTGNEATARAVERAAEVFLTRRMYRRRSDGEVINEDFIRLHYPCFWQYDILHGLKVMAEAGFLNDDRCVDALDLLESKRLPDGGFPAERKYCMAVETPAHGGCLVDWGGVSRRRPNEWVTVDSLAVLRTAGRFVP